MTGGSVTKRMTPPTLKTHVRGPRASTQARSEPGPPSLRFVTLMIAPPRPPCARRPKPSAPGNASAARAAPDKPDSNATIAMDGTIHILSHKSTVCAGLIAQSNPDSGARASDRQCVVSGRSVHVRVFTGARRLFNTKKTYHTPLTI